ncbi:unnamed protein product [Fusarium graminearum]|nr:unnamed protein product [Fusarium graminearum]
MPLLGRAVVGTRRVLGDGTLDSAEACTLDYREVCSLGPAVVGTRHVPEVYTLDSEAYNPDLDAQVDDPAGIAKEDYTAAVHTAHPAQPAQGD